MLESIRRPADLRRLSPNELDDLAGEIRDFIVQSVSETGGHLGSNLGAVELTLALHRVFDSPRDAVLWDTGHQAYVHKLVTGRQAGFEQLRQAGGLSGYPSREESEHDFIENSHASTALSYAYGLAVARDTTADPARRHIVAVVGDGSMTGGMAYEALNNLGHSKRRVIIVLNDNGRSYAPTISNLTDNGHGAVADRVAEKLSHGLAAIRLNPVYVRRQRKLERFLRDLPVVGAPAERGMDAFKAAVREFLQPPSFFEALGVRYVGPIDGHDVVELEHAFRNAIELSAEGPIVVHVLTQKGRGYPPAEDDDEKHLHDAPVFDPAVGPPKAVPTGYTQVFAEAMIKEAEHEPRLVAITAAMPGPTGLLPFQARFPDRFFDVGHRRAARRHRGRRHGDGRAASRRRDLLHLPQPGVGPGGLRRRAPPVTGDLLPRSRRHHRRRRGESPRGLRHGPARQGARHAHPGAVVGRGTAADAPRRDRARRLGTGGHPLPEGQEPLGPRDRGRIGPVGPPDARRRRHAVRARRSASSSPRPRRRSRCWPPTASTPRCGTSAAAHRSTRVMLEDAARHGAVITAEDGIREGGIGMSIADAIDHACVADRLPRVEVLGVPTRFLPHAKPDRILAQLGLDADGIALAARNAIGR